MIESTVSDIKAPISINEILDNLRLDKVDLNYDPSNIIKIANEKLFMNQSYLNSEGLDDIISQITLNEKENFELNEDEGQHDSIDLSTIPKFSSLQVLRKSKIPFSNSNAFKVYRIQQRSDHSDEIICPKYQTNQQEHIINSNVSTEFKKKISHKSKKVLVNSDF